MNSPTHRPRRLPLAVEPGVGESFASYNERLASELALPLSVTLAAVGVVDFDDGHSPRAYGLALSSERLNEVAHSTGLSSEQVGKMLLASYADAAFDLPDVSEPAVVRRRLSREWAYLSGSHVCPACLAETNTWQLAWKLPWSFACLRHNCLLVDTCPACGGRTGAGRSDRRTAPTYLTRIPEIGHCGNSRPPGVARTGRAARPCGEPLSQLIAVDLASHPDILEAQDRLDEVLRGNRMCVGGRNVSSVEFLAAARSLCALILYAAEPEDAAELPQQAAASFAGWVAERTANDETRASLATGGRDRRVGPRTRCYGRVPGKAALMAAIAPRALHILAASSLDDLADRIAPLADRSVARNHRHAQRIPIDFAFSPELSAAFGATLVRRASFSRRLAGCCQTAPVHTYSFTSAHVPQLLWLETYESFFQGLVPGSRPESVRRFCSMSLVKLTRRQSWESAAESLDLPPSQSGVLAGALVSRLSRTGNVEPFIHRLNDAAARLEALPKRVDFATRRLALADFSDIAENRWQEVCARSSIHPGKRGARRRFAAAWLWCELTGGDYRLAPALARGNVQAGRDCYRRFVTRDLPRVQTHLMRYAAELLLAMGLPELSQSSQIPPSCR